MVPLADENETEPLKGSDDVADRGVDRELGHLGWQLCLGHKGLNHWIACFKDFRAETLDMELDGGSDVGEGSVIGVTFAYYDSLEAEGIGDVAVRVLLDDHLQLSCHGYLSGR